WLPRGAPSTTASQTFPSDPIRARGRAWRTRWTLARSAGWRSISRRSPPVSGKLSPPPRSGVRALFSQGAGTGNSCDLHGQLQSEDGAADVVAGRGLGVQAIEGGGGLAVAALALAAGGPYGRSHDEASASGSPPAGRGVAVS